MSLMQPSLPLCWQLRWSLSIARGIGSTDAALRQLLLITEAQPALNIKRQEAA